MDTEKDLNAMALQSCDEPPLRLTLYIAGSTPNSLRAQKHLQTALGCLPSQCYTLETVDVFQEPQRALTDRIIVTPTLLQRTGSSPRMLVGNLSDTEQLHAFLGI